MSEVNKIEFNGTLYTIGSSGGSGLTDDAKLAILACFENVVWVGDDGQDYYNALHDALYPPANLLSISALFSQGSNIIYDNQPLSDLKQYLTVTANYDDASSEVVNTYTLSGTLETGTSTITVGYGGKTTTFTVTVTHATIQYTITNTLTHIVNSNSATVINENLSYSGTLTADNNYVISSVTITMGSTDITSTAYNSSTGTISIASVTGNIVITAVAVIDIGWVSGVAFTQDELDMSEGGYRINSSGEVYESGNASDKVSGFVPCRGASAIMATQRTTDGVIWYYDENEDFIMNVMERYSIEDPFPTPVPRNAYFFRIVFRNVASPTVTPYLYDVLPEDTNYTIDKRYVFDWTGATEEQQQWTYSPEVFCFGVSKIQTSMWARSFVRFYDSNGDEISSAVRQASATEIDVPALAQTMMFQIAESNTNNPWFIYTE